MRRLIAFVASNNREMSHNWIKTRLPGTPIARKNEYIGPEIRYRVLDNAIQVRGLRNAIIYFVGDWKRRSDLDDIISYAKLYKLTMYNSDEQVMFREQNED